VVEVTAGARARVTLIDGFAVDLGDSWDGPRASDRLPQSVQRLVARICLAGRPPRSAIAGQLWPDVPEDHAHASLRSALWRLHKAVPGLVEVSAGSLALAPGVRVDVRELCAWARTAQDPHAGPDGCQVPDARLLGELLPGWYDDWVLLERERLRQLRMHALEQVAGRLAAAGRYGQALEVAYAAVRAEPLRESAHRTLVRVHLAEGNVAEALRAYDHFAAVLEAELGVRPSELMTRLLETSLGGHAARSRGRRRDEVARSGRVAARLR